MKNISLVLNVVLAIAVAGLYFLHFSGKKQTDSSNTGGEASVVSSGDLTIAYINVDSLFDNYKYYDAVTKEFNDKKTKAQDQLELRGRKLQDEVISAEKRAQAGLMSQNEMQRTEQDLAKKQQDLQVYQQTLSQGLLEEEKIIQQKLMENITEYLKEFNKDKKYSLIINYAPGTTVWFANEGLDITSDVLAGLNKKYEGDTTSTEKK